MDKKQFYTILIKNLPVEAEVTEIIHGISWTAARLSNGNVGVAMHTAGDTAPRIFESLQGLNVKMAAQAVLSWNFEEANEGMAVINACYNTIENMLALNSAAPESCQGAIDGLDLKGKTIGFIGHFMGKHSGITEESMRESKAYYTMEREPKEGDLPDPACEYILPICDLVVITGSASINKTMPRLLELSDHAEVILTGPSVPMCKEIFQLGINRLYGNIIVQPDELCESIVKERGSVNKYSKRFLIDC